VREGQEGQGLEVAELGRQGVQRVKGEMQLTEGPRRAGAQEGGGEGGQAVGDESKDPI
jgi:hypothetical protein